MAGETLEGAAVVQEMATRSASLDGRRTHIGPNELPLLRMLCRVITELAPLRIPFDDLLGTVACG